MIYLVTANQQLFNSDFYQIISVKQSLEILKTWPVIQYDSETSGRDARVCKILCIQFGNRAAILKL
jgi:hypothetical protein